MLHICLLGISIVCYFLNYVGDVKGAVNSWNDKSRVATSPVATCQSHNALIVHIVHLHKTALIPVPYLFLYQETYECYSINIISIENIIGMNIEYALHTIFCMYKYSYICYANCNGSHVLIQFSYLLFHNICTTCTSVQSTIQRFVGAKV